jgi:hypothetical protein
MKTDRDRPFTTARKSTKCIVCGIDLECIFWQGLTASMLPDESVRSRDELRDERERWRAQPERCLACTVIERSNQCSTTGE